MYPSDEDFNFVKADTWEPSTTAYRMKLCLECLGEDARELLAVTLLDSPTP